MENIAALNVFAKNYHVLHLIVSHFLILKSTLDIEVTLFC